MKESLSILSWNVEHLRSSHANPAGSSSMDNSDFKKPTVEQTIRNNNETPLTTSISEDEGLRSSHANPAGSSSDDVSRITRVVSFVANANPDVFALYEVEGKTVYQELMSMMPGYQFHITEGAQVQEILVGVKSPITAFFTQRLEFKENNQSLRPGALLTIRQDNIDTTLLFLHVKSGSTPLGLGLRDDMFNRAFKLKKVLDEKAGGKGKARFLFLGDLNSMGMAYPFRHNINPILELKKLDLAAAKAGMRRLSKSAKATWWNGPNRRGRASPALPPSDLDHVVATSNLSFEQYKGAEVRVLGWPELRTKAKRAKWIEEYSDHGAMLFNIMAE